MLYLRTLFALLVFASVCFAADEIDLSNGHYPMNYVSTAETEAHFNALVPRNKSFLVRATPLDRTHNAKAIEGTVVGDAIQDNQKLLHDKVLKFKIAGLTPATKYKLELIESDKHGQKVVDTRTFATFDNKPGPLKFVTGSCMSDEMRYESVRQKVATNLLKQNPDLIVLSGDQTYVDSFDYVERQHATELDVWMRVFRSFQTNPLFRSRDLVPTISTWDDHDTGIDNGNEKTATLADAHRAFLALYGSPEIPGVMEAGKEGSIYRTVSVRGQHFILLDNRSFRTEPDPQSRYGHLGQEQEEWMVGQLKAKKGFFWLVDGGMWGSEAVLSHSHDGVSHRLTEGFHSDHPLQYAAVMKAVHETQSPYAMISGDIHFSQLIEHAPEHAGTPRYAPFRTLEIVSSAMFSIIFPAKPGEPVLWPDKHRITGVKDYNFVTVDAEPTPGGLAINAKSIGAASPEAPLFSFATRIESGAPAESQRRKLLVDKSKFKVDAQGRVQVVIFDADSTLRIAASGELTANNPTDVVLLPGVANKIAELVKEGKVVAIASNQAGVWSKKVKFEGGVSDYNAKFKIADQALQHTMALARAENPDAIFSYYDFAEGPEGDYYHKPNVGMGKHFERVLESEGFKVDWSQSMMVGDSGYKVGEVDPSGHAGDASGDADRLFAENLAIRWVHPQDLFGWTDLARAAIMKHDPKALAAALNCEDILRGK